MSKNNREVGLDALRGIAIIGVVAIHSVSSGYSWRTATEGSWNFWFSLYIRQALNFSVPAFIFLSGYFSGKKTLSGQMQSSSNKLSRVLIPYIFWSLAIILSSSVGRAEFSFQTLIFKLCTGGASTPYYFVLLIAQFYVLTRLLLLLNKHNYGFIVAVTINTTALLCLYIYRIAFSIDPPLYAYALPAFSWIMFYQYGLLVGTNPGLRATIATRVNYFAFLAVLSIFASFLEAFTAITIYDNLSWAASTVKFSSFAYSFFVINLCLWLTTKTINWHKLILTLGDYSFGIYLIHVLFLKNIKHMMNKINFLNSIQPVAQLISISLTLAACIVSVYIARRVLSKNRSVRWLGL